MRYVSVVLLDRRTQVVDLDRCLPLAPGAARVSLPYVRSLSLLAQWLPWHYAPVPGEWPPPAMDYSPLIFDVYETTDRRVIVTTRKDMLKSDFDYWEVDPELAREWCRQAGISRTAISPAAPTSASPPPPAAGLADQLRRRWPRRKLQAALVEYMSDRESASYLDVANTVYGDDATDGPAIEQLVLRTNATLVELKALITYRCGGEYVYRESSPESSARRRDRAET